MASGIISHIPTCLQPVLGRMICVPIRLLEIRTMRKLKPMLGKRLLQMRAESPDEPQDRLQLMLRYAAAHEPQELNAKDMTGRLITANFGAMHQTSYAVSNAILNILSSDAEFDTIRVLRQEINIVMQRHRGRWTRTSIAQMTHTDSAIRETLRLHGFTARLVRVVTAKDGIITEDGVHVPYGSCVSILQRAPHLDESKFARPKLFDPFRFSRDAHSTSSDASGAGPQSFVTFSSTNLPFGSGKHACPGRFLVDFEIKMILAYLLINYDLKLATEHNGLRPPSPQRTEATFPPTSAKFSFKRRGAPAR